MSDNLCSLRSSRKYFEEIEFRYEYNSAFYLDNVSVVRQARDSMGPHSQ
jgi:hypothetical protein